ncbi:uncharacterized protein LOC134765963 [Penaeus indicus]|uniref:uncharacterized protein LOC134765963 n=1 Tax=Penaeus indicus TaxID=29960 RepID=UPI00300D730F
MLHAARHTVTRARARVCVRPQAWYGGHRVWYGLLLLWLVVAVHVTVLNRPRAAHPALTRACYAQSNKGARLGNTCCRMLNYTRGDAAACVKNAAAAFSLMQSASPHFHSPNEYLVRFKPNAMVHGGSGAPQQSFPGWAWVVAGDSRMRQIFSALVTRLSSPRLKYKKPSTRGKWRSVHELLEPLRIGKLHEDIELYHMDLPLRLLFFWDPQLLRMPKMVQEWTSYNSTPPSLLVLGTSLHWMKGNLDKYRASGPEAAMEDFQEHMKTFIPQLDQLAASSHIVIQLQDHIQESHIYSEYQGIYSNQNIERYNNYLRSIISTTKLTLWDSNIPFSEAYFSECRKNNRNSLNKTWNCDNPLHTGYIMVEEYANMILNDVCNPYLQLGETFC